MTPAPPSSRGPSGPAPLPPAWLATVSLPVDVIRAGTPLFRIHRSDRDPIVFGPGKHALLTYRFDSLTGAFGVLYVGLSLAVALVETILRNPIRRIVNYPVEVCT